MAELIAWPQLWRAFRAGGTCLPFAPGLPGTESWLCRPDEKPPPAGLFWLNLRRFLLLHALGQQRWWRPRIPASAGEILWLHLSDHVGDSLMRLSSVPLLAGRQVDLYASPKAAQLFEPGNTFRQVVEIDEQGSELAGRRYDCLIIDALHTQPLLLKRRLFPRVPFVSLHDFFHYCRDDYNLTLFAWYRLAHLLEARVSAGELARQARLRMDHGGVAPDLYQGLGLDGGEIALALGGREGYRIYRHWPEVAGSILAQSPDRRLVLVGSENAAEDAVTICAAFPGRVINCVNRLSLKETAHVLHRTTLLVCADGGLLHVANAVACPTVGLFAQELPEYRYVAADRRWDLRSDQDVNAILSTEVAQVVEQALAELKGQGEAGR